MEQSFICCIWRSNRDFKPNYSHKTDFFFFFEFLFYFWRKKKLTHFFHILGSVAEGNTTFFLCVSYLQKAVLNRVCMHLKAASACLRHCKARDGVKCYIVYRWQRSQYFNWPNGDLVSVRNYCKISYFILLIIVVFFIIMISVLLCFLFVVVFVCYKRWEMKEKQCVKAFKGILCDCLGRSALYQDFISKMLILFYKKWFLYKTHFYSYELQNWCLKINLGIPSYFLLLSMAANLNNRWRYSFGKISYWNL